MNFTKEVLIYLRDQYEKATGSKMVHDSSMQSSQAEFYFENLQEFRGCFGENVGKKMEQTYEGVVLTTAHSSKGLEWKNVFLSVSEFDSKTLHSHLSSGRNHRTVRSC